MVQTTPSPFDVGRAFVHQYYTLLHQAPELLHRFYANDSTFVHGGVDRPGATERTAVGPKEIADRIKELNLRDCHAKIRQVDSHPTIGQGVVVQVTGELSNNGHPMRRFMQTFVLAPRLPKKYYVQNDIFRYQDEVFDDGSDEDDHSSSQNYGDMDKASNADSSVAVPQQPLLVAATPRETTEEVQQQPLPPRQVNVQQQQQQQQQVIENPTVQAKEPLNGLNESTGYNGQQEPTQEGQQQSKPTTTEGTSYAGVTKLHATGGSASTVTSTNPAPIHPPQTTSTNRPAANKSAPSRTNTQRNNSNYHPSTSHVGNMRGGESHQEFGSGRRSAGSVAPLSNEHQVFVGSLPPTFLREDLIKCFQEYGNVVDAKIQMPAVDNKKNFGFVTFETRELAASVASLEHVEYKGIRLNVEAKTQKSFSGTTNNGPQGGSRNSFPPRGNASRGGNRGSFRSGPRRGGGGSGQYHNQPSSAMVRDENHKTEKQQHQ